MKEKIKNEILAILNEEIFGKIENQCNLSGDLSRVMVPDENIVNILIGDNVGTIAVCTNKRLILIRYYEKIMNNVDLIPLKNIDSLEISCAASTVYIKTKNPNYTPRIKGDIEKILKFGGSLTV